MHIKTTRKNVTTHPVERQYKKDRQCQSLKLKPFCIPYGLAILPLNINTTQSENIHPHKDLCDNVYPRIIIAVSLETAQMATNQ